MLLRANNRIVLGSHFRTIIMFANLAKTSSIHLAPDVRTLKIVTNVLMVFTLKVNFVSHVRKGTITVLIAILLHVCNASQELTGIRILASVLLVQTFQDVFQASATQMVAQNVKMDLH
jgi:hypothetical protein